MATSASLTAPAVAVGGISPSMVQSAHLRQPIDGIFIVWNNIKFQRNPHRPRHIEGICEKLRKGTVRVGFWVGKCVGTGAGYKGGDAATGFHSVSRIYVEEVSPPQA